MKRSWITLFIVLAGASYLWMVLAVSLMLWPSASRFAFLVLLGIVIAVGVVAAFVHAYPILSKQSRRLRAITEAVRRQEPLLQQMDTDIAALTNDQRLSFKASASPRLETGESSSGFILAIMIHSAEQLEAALQQFHQYPFIDRLICIAAAENIDLGQLALPPTVSVLSPSAISKPNMIRQLCGNHLVWFAQSVNELSSGGVDSLCHPSDLLARIETAK